MNTQRCRRTLDEPITLDRVVTHGGNQGTTTLGTGRRVPKCDLRVEAYDEVDELNAALGLAVAALPARSRFRPWLGRVQNDLFDLGTDLAVEWIDRACEQANRELAPLRTFVLPGGSETSAPLQLARTVCRRAERRSVALARREPVNPHLLAYLNRLGDLLFILARVVDADSGEQPRLWRPAATMLARAAEQVLPGPLPALPASA